MPRDMQQYLRPGLTSTPFCPGCGHGILMGLILRAIHQLELDMDEMLFVSGIGCAAWIPSPHFNADTLHILHGRAIPAATGAKMFNPKLRVMVISGDGDLVDIGGNHLIHAARRNMDLTVICASNMVYGMTGGQMSSATSIGAYTQTTTHGNPYQPLDPCKLVIAAGATYSARYSVTQPFALITSIKKALQIDGFCFIEVLSPCPTQFGRYNQLDTPVAMVRNLMENCIAKKKARKLSPEKLKGKIITGEFTNGAD
ncbi:MAG: 2-oxoacid:ferredoxin oxidoreductase subunit beta [Chloroflexota bacterium]|nr:MAG: 2-oxoacid:ferredoxin oxidoreductase subunit beta [Chloroflexota bacterium]